MMSTSGSRILLPVLFGLVAVPSPGLAQSRVPDLSQVSIEDLMSIEITSAFSLLLVTQVPRSAGLRLRVTFP